MAQVPDHFLGKLRCARDQPLRDHLFGKDVFWRADSEKTKKENYTPISRSMPKCFLKKAAFCRLLPGFFLKRIFKKVRDPVRFPLVYNF